MAVRGTEGSVAECVFAFADPAAAPATVRLFRRTVVAAARAIREPSTGVRARISAAAPAARCPPLAVSARRALQFCPRGDGGGCPKTAPLLRERLRGGAD